MSPAPDGAEDGLDDDVEPRLEHLLASAAGHPRGLAALPAARCAAALALDGLTISLFDHSDLELVWCDETDRAGIALEDLQYTLGEGPTREAAHRGLPVIVSDLLTEPAHRWPALLAATRHGSVRAVLSLPLHLGVIRMGALTGHRSTPGRPTRSRMTDALALAETATSLLLAPGGTRDIGGHTELPLHRALVHQAAGALSSRLGIPVGDALARLRAYAFTHDRPVLDVAQDVVHRRARLDDA